MSEIERLDLTAGGDALVETIKTNDADAILQLTEYASEHIDVTSENATATKESEVSTETICLKTNTEYMFEENNNPSTYVVQPKFTDTENLTAEDASAIRVDTQTPVVEISSTSITLQDEETSQKSINEEKVKKKQNNKILLF
jgi:hypothetical protein